SRPVARYGANTLASPARSSRSTAPPSMSGAPDPTSRMYAPSRANLPRVVRGMIQPGFIEDLGCIRTYVRVGSAGNYPFTVVAEVLASGHLGKRDAHRSGDR